LEGGGVTDYQTVARVRSCLRRKFSDIDVDRLIFWLAVVLAALSILISGYA
jgi:hypothetical protein